MFRRRTNSVLFDARPVCSYGTECYRRNPDHFLQEAHPADEDYLRCCREAGVQPTFVSIRKIFDWADVDTVGKVSKVNLETVWDELERLGENVGPLEEVWEKLDEDGNGYINFSEFAQFAEEKHVNLPLGLDNHLCRSGSGSVREEQLRCGVEGCECRCFKMRRPRCKYGAECYQMGKEHRASFLHPGDEGWEASSSTGRDKNMCVCGHKRSLHASPFMGFRSVSYPSYWTSDVSSGVDFSSRVPVENDWVVAAYQKLVDATYSDVTTRDRVKSCGTWMVPRGFTVESVARNENSRLWRKYLIKKGGLLAEASPTELPTDSTRSSAEAADSFEEYSDIRTTKAWAELAAEHQEELGGSEGELPEAKINEWMLFHGTSSEAAEAICGTDFTMRMAGKATGTLYGRGTYLAESITKADEYATEEDGVCTVLLCRVLGGRVRYCDDRTPDAEALTKECTKGVYDCIMGDRVKVSGTYREFVVFDTENVYPEYVVKYRRGEFFKSPSHP